MKLLNRQWQHMDGGSAWLSLLACHFVAVASFVLFIFMQTLVIGAKESSILEIFGSLLAVILLGFFVALPYGFLWWLCMMITLGIFQQLLTVRISLVVFLSGVIGWVARYCLPVWSSGQLTFLPDEAHQMGALELFGTAVLWTTVSACAGITFWVLNSLPAGQEEA